MKMLFVATCKMLWSSALSMTRLGRRDADIASFLNKRMHLKTRVYGILNYTMISKSLSATV